jgi:large subunit ribosomal protein L10
MDNPRAEKVAVVEEVRTKLSAAEAAVVTEYRGLSVAAISELRRALREAGGDYKIYKNTLVRFAARDLGLEIDELLTGPTAIAFVDGDAAAVAKALRDYAKANPNLVVKGGLLGSKVIDAASVNALAELPSREQLLSEIAGLFAAPMQQFAGLLDAVPRSFAYALQALVDKGGNPGVAEAPQAPAAAPEAEEAPAAAPEAADETPAATETAPTETTDDAPAAEADAPAEENE